MTTNTQQRYFGAHGETTLDKIQNGYMYGDETIGTRHTYPSGFISDSELHAAADRRGHTVKSFVHCHAANTVFYVTE